MNRTFPNGTVNVHAEPHPSRDLERFLKAQRGKRLTRQQRQALAALLPKTNFRR